MEIKKKKEGKWNYHVPDDDLRDSVKLHARVGTPQAIIAKLLKITPKTLRKHYRQELDFGLVEANAEVCGLLLNKCRKEDTAAILFWLKTRAGFRETQYIHQETKEVKKFSDFYDDPVDDETKPST